jgi:predicted metalloprotease with PDZ domain
MEKASKLADVRFSIGLILRREKYTKEDGTILDVIPGTPAAQAGIGPGMKLIAVNGRQWSPGVLRDALRQAKGTPEPIELLVENANDYKAYQLDSHDGERYPHLERNASQPDLLGQIIRPRVASAASKLE